MNEQQLSPETIATQNALICEKLLGLTKHCDEPDCHDWRTADGRRYWNNPTFETWAQAGLILDALAKAGQRPDLGHYQEGEWHCMVNATDECVPATFSTGPLAIRDAALAYIEARTEHEAAEGERAEAARDGDWKGYYP